MQKARKRKAKKEQKGTDDAEIKMVFQNKLLSLYHVFLSHFTQQFASVTVYYIHLLKFKLWNLSALLISYQEEQVPPSKKQKVKAQPKKKVKKGLF